MRGAKQIEKIMLEISDLRRREILHLRSVCHPGGGGGASTLIFSYIGRLGLLLFFCFCFCCFLFFFWGGGSKFCISIISGVFRRIFCGYFCGSSQHWTVLRAHNYKF